MQKKLFSVGSATPQGLPCTSAWSPCGTNLAVAVGNQTVLVHDRHGALVNEILIQDSERGSDDPAPQLQVQMCLKTYSTQRKHVSRQS
jgi:hypothetical protein